MWYAKAATVTIITIVVVSGLFAGSAHVRQTYIHARFEPHLINSFESKMA